MTKSDSMLRYGSKSIQAYKGSAKYHDKYYELWEKQANVIWTMHDISMDQDAVDYAADNEENRRVIETVFKTFTSNDVSINSAYSVIANLVNPSATTMMLMEYASVENVHITSYSLLTDTLGFDKEFYEEFLHDPVLISKFKMLQEVIPKSYEEVLFEEDYNIVVAHRVHTRDVLLFIFVFSLCIEGLSLFAQFAILLNFGRGGKYSGMTDVNLYSQLDESFHVEGNATIFNDIVAEYPDYMTSEFRDELMWYINYFVNQELDLVQHRIFTMESKELKSDDGTTTLSLQEMEDYIKYLANFRLEQVNLPQLFPNTRRNPLLWIDEMLLASSNVNFFTNTPTEYVNNSTKGTRGDVREMFREMKEKEKNA